MPIRPEPLGTKLGTKPCEHVLQEGRFAGQPMHPRGHCPTCDKPMGIGLVATWPYCGYVCRAAGFRAAGLPEPTISIRPEAAS